MELAEETSTLLLFVDSPMFAQTTSLIPNWQNDQACLDVEVIGMRGMGGALIGG